MELSDLIEGRPPAAIKEQLDAHPKDAGQFSFSRHHYKVLLSLREDWLPELEALRDTVSDIHKMGASIVLISPQIGEYSRQTSEKYNLSIPILSDAGNNVASSFGLVFRLPDELRKLYKQC